MKVKDNDTVNLIKEPDIITGDAILLTSGCQQQPFIKSAFTHAGLAIRNRTENLHESIFALASSRNI